MAIKILFRKDTGANWSSANPVLSEGEAGYDTTAGNMKIGDGVTAWNSLAYITAVAADSMTSLSDTEFTSLSDGQILTYDLANSKWVNSTLTHYTSSDFDTDFSGKSTTDLTEGTNLYYTDARARGAISATGDLSYNATTGVITYDYTEATHALTDSTDVTITTPTNGQHLEYVTANSAWENKDLTITESQITDLQSYSVDGHTHAIANVTGLQTALDGKAATSHTHIIADVTNLQTTLDGKAATSHTHAIANVTGLQTALDGKVDDSQVLTDVPAGAVFTDTTYSNVSEFNNDSGYLTSFSETDPIFTASNVASVTSGQITNWDTAYSWGDHSTQNYSVDGHTHTIANVTGLQSALDGKASTSHSHIIADVTGLQTALDGKVDDSQVLTNVPAGAVFTDTTYANVSEFVNDVGYLTSETLTALTYNPTNTTLTFTDENSNPSVIDLSGLLDEDNRAIASGVVNPTTGIVTYTRDDATTFDVDMSAFLDDTNLSRINSASFDTGTGVLTLTRNDASNITVDLDGKYAEASHTHIIADVTGLQSALDGKVDDSQVLTNVPAGAVFTDTTYANVSEFNNDSGYLTSYTETDPIFTASNVASVTSGQITNWDTAYSWGDHSTQNYSVDGHTHAIANVTGLQTALDGKVDDAQVLTNVPAGAVFTDTTYTNLSEFTNDVGFLTTVASLDSIGDVDTTGVADADVLSYDLANATWIASTPVAGYSSANFDSDFATKTTNDLTENTNLYYTDARARNAISATGDISYVAGTGVISYTEATHTMNDLTDVDTTGVADADVLSYDLANATWIASTPVAGYSSANFDSDFASKSTTDLTEGTNLYYTDARFDTRLGTKSTTDLSEGTNLYHTDARARSAISAGGDLAYNSTTGVISYTEATHVLDDLTNVDTSGLVDGDVLSYDLANTKWVASTLTTHYDTSDFNTDFATKSTTDLTEGTNLYHTDARARNAISATGDISYVAGTGVISYTEATHTMNDLTDVDDTGITNGQVLSYVTANAQYEPTTITHYTSSDFDTDFATKSTTDLTEGTNLYHTDARARSAISAGGDLAYNSTTGVISYTEATHALDDLTDVVITTPPEFSHLEYDGSNWVDVQNLTIADGDKLIFSGNAEVSILPYTSDAGLGNLVYTNTTFEAAWNDTYANRGEGVVDYSFRGQGTDTGHIHSQLRTYFQPENQGNVGVSNFLIRVDENGTLHNMFLAVPNVKLSLGLDDVTSAADIEITTTKIAHALPTELASYTTTQRDALSPSAGWVIFNTTTSKMECYDGTTWQAAW